MSSSIPEPIHSIQAALVLSIQLLELLIEFYSKTWALESIFQVNGKTYEISYLRKLVQPKRFQQNAECCLWIDSF